jgi:tetratricopeptide (TPR) repeat protein
MSQFLDSFEENMRNFFDGTRTYGKEVGAVAVVILVLALSWLGYDAYKDKKEQAATTALYPFQSDYVKTREAFDKAKFKDLTPPSQDPESDSIQATKKASGDLQTDFGVDITGFEKVAHDYVGTKAGAQASIYLAEIYNHYGQFEKSAAAAQAAAQSVSQSNVLYAIAQLELGNANANQGHCKEALEAYAKVVSQTFLKPDAYLKSGVCYESLGQADQAADMYRKASEDTQSSTGQTAKTLLRALEIKKTSPAQKG